MGRDMVTIKDIATEAGVSKSTVSRVLNKNGFVSEDARKRVQEVIEKYDYQPSESARALCQKTTKMIGVIFPRIHNDFYGEVMQGITQAADERQMSLIFCNTDDDGEKEERAMRLLKGQRVRGVILALTKDNLEQCLCTRLQKQIQELNAPVVFLDRTMPNRNDSVLYDNFGAAYRATEELIKAGNRRIGVITGDMNLKIGKERFEGYLQAMQDHQVEVMERYIYYGDFMMNRAYELSCAMYDSGDYPDAVMTSNNDTTLGFLRATRKRSMKLGREIAMVGIDHITVLDTIGYQYSHIGRDSVGMGRKAMELLNRKILHPEREPQTIVMPYIVNLMGTERKRTKRD